MYLSYIPNYYIKRFIIIFSHILFAVNGFAFIIILLCINNYIVYYDALLLFLDFVNNTNDPFYNNPEIDKDGACTITILFDYNFTSAI